MVRVSEKLPPLGHRVIVMCKGSRCLGYRDWAGQWRDDAQERELEGVVGWMEVWAAGNATGA